MKNILFLLSIFLSFTTTYGQDNLCHKNILNHNQVYKKNEIKKYSKYVFSSLWLEKDNELVYGIIGNNYQRILFKITSVKKNPHKENEYLVYGKTNVKSNICDFIGKININEIQEFKNQNFGVDDEYKNKGIKTQGVITAKYEFFENKNQKHAGKFYGILKSTWYLDKQGVIKYNDININSDSYFNNSFVGKWKMYNSTQEKICNWGDYRVPNTKCDFDIGAGEFSISQKYINNGWSIRPKKGWWK